MRAAPTLDIDPDPLPLRARCLEFFGTPDVWDAIQVAYSEPHRAYHNLAHLAWVFAAVDLRVAPGVEHRRALELAIWFHDFVYRTDPFEAAQDNERQSAQALLTVLSRCAPHTLNWRDDDRNQVALASDMILSTKTHRPVFTGPAPRTAAEHTICAVLLDADLSILAAPPAAVDLYDQNVAREWGVNWAAPPAAFAAARHRILTGLLDGPVFHSRAFADLERAGRANLRRLIDRWRQRMRLASP